MSLDGRLNRVMPALSASQRALLVLRDFKAGKPQDRVLAHGMSGWEVREYNRLIRLIRVCNSEVFTLITVLQGRAEVLAVRLGLLLVLNMWGEHADMVSLYLRAFTKEPITESEYERRRKTEPERWAHLPELANVLTSRKVDWLTEQIEDPANEIIYSEDWEAECARQKKLLLAAVRRGELESKGKGKDLAVKVGSFWGWLGEEVALRPAWGFDFDPAPDGEAALVERLLHNRETIGETFTGRELPGEEKRFPLYWTMAAHTQELVTEGVKFLWAEVLGLDGAIRLIAQREFAGEDLLKPAIREDLDGVVSLVKRVHAGLEEIVGPVELPEVGEDKVQENLEYIEHFVALDA